MLPGLQGGTDGLPRDAVEVVVDLRVLQQLTGGHMAAELLRRHEVVVDAFHLPFPGRAGGHGRGPRDRSSAFARAVHHGVLADAGGACQDDDQRRRCLPLHVVQSGHALPSPLRSRWRSSSRRRGCGTSPA